MKFFLKIGLFSLIILGFASCEKKENYSIIPAITYKSLVENSDGSATLQVSFTDGDGDIGYNTTNPPVDFFVEILQRDSVGQYQPIIDQLLNDPVMGDTAYVPYNVPYITPSGSDKELSGQIQVVMTSGSWYFAANTYMEFKVWLVDRAGHISNKILTPPIISP